MIGLPCVDGCDMPFIQYTLFSLYFIPKNVWNLVVFVSTILFLIYEVGPT